MHSKIWTYGIPLPRRVLYQTELYAYMEGVLGFAPNPLSQLPLIMHYTPYTQFQGSDYLVHKLKVYSI